MSFVKFFLNGPDSGNMSPHLGDVLLREGEAAEFLRVSPATLRYWRRRAQRRGPSWIKIERRPVRYRLADLQAYLEERTVRVGARK
jgi:predicted DNA-binding transcriptional regulator AlpA